MKSATRSIPSGEVVWITWLLNSDFTHWHPLTSYPLMSVDLLSMVVAVVVAFLFLLLLVSYCNVPRRDPKFIGSPSRSSSIPFVWMLKSYEINGFPEDGLRNASHFFPIAIGCITMSVCFCSVNHVYPVSHGSIHHHLFILCWSSMFTDVSVLLASLPFRMVPYDLWCELPHLEDHPTW